MADTPLVKLLKSLRLPSDRNWFDGRLITSVTEPTVSHVQFAGGDTLQLAPANPSRIAIGFFTANLNLTQEAVAPWPEVQDYPFNATGVQIGEWYTLFDYPGLISNKWFGYFINPVLVRVVDIARIEGQ